MAVVFDEKRGPIRVVLEVNGGALALFKTSEANTIRKTALTAGGNFWVANFLGKRFNASYATTALGYRVSEKWKRYKERDLGQAIPFIGYTPTNGGNPPSWREGRNQTKMLDAVMTGTRVDATARDGNDQIRIFIPFGHPLQADAAQAFKTVPDFEVTAIAREVGRVLSALISGARESGKKSAPRTLVGVTVPISGRSLPGGGPRKVG